MSLNSGLLLFAATSAGMGNSPRFGGPDNLTFAEEIFKALEEIASA